MATPTVTATAVTNGTTASATPSILLPATVNVGDILIAMIRADNEEAYTWPAGWNALVSDVSDAADDQTGCRWKLADGTEDGTSISLSRTQSNKFAALSYAIGGADHIEVSSLAIGSSTAPNPPSFSPSGGLQDYLFLWMGGWQGEQTSPPTGNPTNYTNPIGANSGTAGATSTNARVASARRAVTGTTEDPPAWTISVTDAWTAFAIALWTPPAVPKDQWRNILRGPSGAAMRAVR